MVSVFQSRLADLDKVNRRAIGEQLLRGLGRALELEEILSEIFGVTEAPPRPAQPKQPKRPQAAVERYRVNHMAD